MNLRGCGPPQRAEKGAPPTLRTGSALLKNVAAKRRPLLHFDEPAPGMKARRAETIEHKVLFKNGDGLGSRQPGRVHAGRTYSRNVQILTRPLDKTKWCVGQSV